MAIALALQDTLSNLVSGFLLLADRPFKDGDWCYIDGNWLSVQHIGWRTTRFKDEGNGGTRIIPNGALSKTSFTNCHQEGAMWKQYFTVGFSYDDPPTIVKDVMYDVADSVEERWSDYRHFSLVIPN